MTSTGGRLDMATTRPKLTTADELWAIGGDSCRYDLIEGELYRISPASPKYGKFAARVARHLDVFVDERDLGEVYGAESGFRLSRDPDTVLAPDAAFVRTEKIPPDDEQDGFWDVVPDLVVEVISPSDTVRYLVDKVAAYLEAGVSVVLTIDPKRFTVSAHTQDGIARTLQVGDVLELPDILPGFAVPVSEIFRRVERIES
jgi:Uma2 family endonuclease